VQVKPPSVKKPFLASEGQKVKQGAFAQRQSYRRSFTTEDVELDISSTKSHGAVRSLSNIEDLWLTDSISSWRRPHLHPRTRRGETHGGKRAQSQVTAECRQSDSILVSHDHQTLCYCLHITFEQSNKRWWNLCRNIGSNLGYCIIRARTIKFHTLMKGLIHRFKRRGTRRKGQVKGPTHGDRWT